MIIVLGKRLYRLLVAVLLLIIVFPLIQYYALRTVNQQAVHFQEPRGSALKVTADMEDREPYYLFPRFLHYVHEFYQNGL